MRKAYLFSIIVILASTLATAQSLKEYKLDEVVVSANRVETPALEVANTFTIITREEIVKSGKSTLTEILREVPGVYITQQGGPGRLSSIFLRGANSNYTLVMIDGVEVNDPASPGGAFDLSTISLSNIERIEIIREPQSTLYGSDALAGIVNIITRSGDKNQYSFNVEGGSEKFAKASAAASGSFGELKYFVGFSRQQNEGISAISEKYGADELDGYSNNNLQAKFNYNFGKNLDASFLYRYTLHKAELDRTGKFGDDPNYEYDAESQIFSFKTKAIFFDGKLNSEFSAGMLRRISHTENLPDDNDPSSSRAYSSASKIKFSLVNNFTLNETHLITFGIETEEEKANTEYHSASSWGSFSSIFEPNSARTTGLFLQNKYSDGKFFLTAGVRYDIHEKFGNITTFRVAPAYFIASTSTKIKATYAGGFKTPSLFNLFDPLYGNPDLKPEKSAGFDFGFEQFLLHDNLSVEAVYFQNDFTDLIGYDRAFKPININKAKTKGYEIAVNYRRDNLFEAKMSYTYTKATDESEGADNNEQLIRRPENKALFAVTLYPISKLNISANVRYIGKRYDLDFSAFPAERVELKEYTLVDFTASYDLFSFLSLYVKADNVFDTEYEDVLYYGTLGRSFYLGLNINY